MVLFFLATSLQGLRLLDCNGHRFFNEDVRTGGEKILRHVEMAPCRGRNGDRIDLTQQITVIGQPRCAVFIADFDGCFRVTVDDRDEFTALEASVFLCVKLAEISGTYNRGFQRRLCLIIFHLSTV